MEKFYVELNGEGDHEYTEALMVGATEPSTVFSYFSHPRVTRKSKDYVAAYQHLRVGTRSVS